MPRRERKYDSQQIYNYIVQFKIEHDGNSPSLREIQAAIGISSTSVVHYHLQRLKDSGLITLGDNSQISVVGGQWHLT